MRTTFRHDCGSAALPVEVPDEPIYPVCMSLAGATGRAWAALDGVVGRRVSAGRLGERLGRRREIDRDPTAIFWG